MKFNVGLYQLNDNVNYNFQLNRLINWDGGDLYEIKSISEKIKTNLDWKNELIKLADKALKGERIKNAIAYYRMSEFFMADSDADKLRYYKKAKDLFYGYYDEFFKGGNVVRKYVPFENMKLPVLYAKSKNEKKGTIIFHGGNDSYLEELFFPMLYFSKHGYDVYLFEGPGQGGVLREQGIKFTYRWELPVGALLDYFGLEDVIIVGVSLGGMLAPRAAAFEKRIKKIVAWSIFPNFLDVALYDLNRSLKIFFKFLLKIKGKHLINYAISKRMKKDVFYRWVFEHGMYAYGAKSPYDYINKLNDFQITNIADRIDQDILILHGMRDHFIDWHLYKDEIDNLVHAKSISLRLFTEKEEASDHCQCGNTKLALDTILKWLM